MRIDRSGRDVKAGLDVTDGTEKGGSGAGTDEATSGLFFPTWPSCDYFITGGAIGGIEGDGKMKTRRPSW